MCPLCLGDPFKGKTGDDMYNMGAYDVDTEKIIECGACGGKIKMEPYQSIDWNFEELEEEWECAPATTLAAEATSKNSTG